MPVFPSGASCCQQEFAGPAEEAGLLGSLPRARAAPRLRGTRGSSAPAWKTFGSGLEHISEMFLLLCHWQRPLLRRGGSKCRFSLFAAAWMSPEWDSLTKIPSPKFPPHPKGAGAPQPSVPHLSWQSRGYFSSHSRYMDGNVHFVQHLAHLYPSFQCKAALSALPPSHLGSTPCLKSPQFSFSAHFFLPDVFLLLMWGCPG